MNYKKLLGTASAALMIVMVILTWAPGTWAQVKFKTLHKFTGGKDGGAPWGVPVFDAAGNLYGTTTSGGLYGSGTVFELTPRAGGGWTESVLYSFTGGDDGGTPLAGLIFDAAGNLYGTTSEGGTTGNGIVFELSPSPEGSWTESVLHSFTGADGSYPNTASLIFDAAGNLYSTTSHGGSYGSGVAFELTPNPDGSWTESVLSDFCSLEVCRDGNSPAAGLIFDQAGNLYGTTQFGGADGYGTVFELTPNPDGSWEEKVLHTFHGKNGAYPSAGLIFDQAGNLYGTTQHGGNYGDGVVFELTPNADGTWTEQVLHRFTGNDGVSPDNNLIPDSSGNLYCTTQQGGRDGFGTVFELTPKSSGGWRETVLHAFTDHWGADPVASLIFDAAGNLYGATQGDGTTTFGSVYEITP